LQALGLSPPMPGTGKPEDLRKPGPGAAFACDTSDE
jgi:hypothetical protein